MKEAEAKQKEEEERKKKAEEVRLVFGFLSVAWAILVATKQDTDQMLCVFV